MPSLATASAGLVAEAGPSLDLDARMALVEAEMTARLNQAALAVAVNTAAIDTHVDLDDTIRGPVAMPLPPLMPYPTPVAALLQRAARRMATLGWGRGMVADTDGAVCCYGAIHAESGTPGAETAAMDVLLEAIRRHSPGADRIESWNDAQGDGRMPVRMLGEAADLANARGI